MDALTMERGLETLLTLRVGAGGNAGTHIGGGWSVDEPDGRWMVGPASEFWLENPGQGGDLLMELDVALIGGPPEAVQQRLVIAVRDKGIAQIVVRRTGTLAFHIPASLVEAPGPVRILFIHPDFRRPVDIGDSTDDRPLSLRARSLRLHRILPRPRPSPGPALPPEDMMMRFESLGDNCEFGLVQRRLGAEPLGLLRFSFTDVPLLLRGLRSGFEGLGEPGTIQVSVEGQDDEFIVKETAFGLTYHTFETADKTDIETVRSRQPARLKFLRRKLLEDAASAARIFVIKRNDPLPPEDALAVYTALNERGANWLLWMVPADAAHPPGSVEYLLPGLLRGYIDRFAPTDNAHDLSLEVWSQVCAAAWRLVGGALGG